jgi:opacity protein-like surface antigen
MGHTRSIIAGILLAAVQTAGAYAADFGLPLPPVEPEPCCDSPWYFKGFVGGANPNVGDIFSEGFRTNKHFVSHEDIKSSPLEGIGIGYGFNKWLRFDITGEYRGDATFLAQDKYRGGNGTFNRASNEADGTFPPGTNEYTADIQSWVGLANAYIDFGTWRCITPYVGGGVGLASISVNGLKDVNVPNNGVAYATDNTDTNFAWAVYGGLAYDVTPNFTVDLSYRYLDMGDAKSGRVRAFDNSATNSGFFIDDITSQDVMLGVRYKFGGCCGPEPTPVALK